MRIVHSVLAGSILLGASPLLASPALPNYTFHMDVTMRMHTFPWLRIGMEGDGEYRPGELYQVRFTKTPWFLPQKSRATDLSMLDPAMWPKHYRYEETGKRDADTLYTLHALNDPTLQSATVAVDADGCVRDADANYTDGSHIHMSVTPASVDGFMLPVSLVADITEPHAAFSADAAFKNYVMGAAPTVSATP